MDCQPYHIELVDEGIEWLLEICRMSSPGPGTRIAYSLEPKGHTQCSELFWWSPLIALSYQAPGNHRVGAT